jgi:hypothetical protein
MQRQTKPTTSAPINMDHVPIHPTSLKPKNVYWTREALRAQKRKVAPTSFDTTPKASRDPQGENRNHPIPSRFPVESLEGPLPRLRRPIIQVRDPRDHPELQRPQERGDETPRASQALPRAPTNASTNASTSTSTKASPTQDPHPNQEWMMEWQDALRADPRRMRSALRAEDVERRAHMTAIRSHFPEKDIKTYEKRTISAPVNAQHTLRMDQWGKKNMENPVSPFTKRAYPKTQAVKPRGPDGRMPKDRYMDHDWFNPRPERAEYDRKRHVPKAKSKFKTMLMVAMNLSRQDLRVQRATMPQSVVGPARLWLTSARRPLRDPVRPLVEPCPPFRRPNMASRHHQETNRARGLQRTMRDGSNFTHGLPKVQVATSEPASTASRATRASKVSNASETRTKTWSKTSQPYCTCPERRPDDDNDARCTMIRVHPMVRLLLNRRSRHTRWTERFTPDQGRANGRPSRGVPPVKPDEWISIAECVERRAMVGARLPQWAKNVHHVGLLGLDMTLYRMMMLVVVPPRLSQWLAEVTRLLEIPGAKLALREVDAENFRRESESHMEKFKAANPRRTSARERDLLAMTEFRGWTSPQPLVLRALPSRRREKTTNRVQQT